MPVEHTQSNPQLQRIPAAGQETAHPYDAHDAHAFQQGLAGQAPPPVAGVRFPALTDPPSSRIGHQNAQFIHNLYTSSPTFHNALNTATQDGQHPIDVHYGQVAQGHSAQWRSKHRQVVVNPIHPSLRPNGVGGLQGVTSFELINAANRHGFEQIRNNANNGHYERTAATVNAQHPDQRPVTAGELFSHDMESQEWQTAKTHHQAMTEAAAEGMPLFPGADRLAPGFGDNPGGFGSWHHFDNYHAEQLATGHSQLYVDQYNQAPRLSSQGKPSQAQDNDGTDPSRRE